MKILLTTQPAIGHLHPMIPLARAMRRAGHEVAFASSRSFRGVVESLGFHCFEAGLDWLESEAGATFPELARMTPGQATVWFLKELFADRAARAMVPDVIDIARTWKPELIVRGTWEFSGCVAAEYLDIPHASISASLYFGIWQGMIGEQMARLRGEFGLPADPGLEMLYRYLYLDLVPPGLHFPSLPRAPVVHSLRMESVEPRAGLVAPAWLEALPERPTVYVTLGTVFNRIPGVFAAMLEGLKQEPVNVILTVGGNQDPATFGPQPPHVRIERYIPQSLLLPRCDVVVTHGGFNTMLAALVEGTPMVVTPLAADQPQNALRVRASGSGIVLPAHPEVATLPMCQELASCTPFSPTALREAVHQVLHEPGYRRAAARVRDEAASQPGMERGVELLETLVATRKPLLNR